MVGSHCAEYFASEGHNVMVYDNLMRSTIFQSKGRIGGVQLAVPGSTSRDRA